MTPNPTPTCRTASERGVFLPWVEISQPKIYDKAGTDLTPRRPNRPEVLASGEVFVAIADLLALAEQSQGDSLFGPSLLVNDRRVATALTAAGWARAETRGGYSGTDALRRWLNENGPYDFSMTDLPTRRRVVSY